MVNFSSLLLLPNLTSATKQMLPMPETPWYDNPKLSGHHFRITLVEQAGYVNMDVDNSTGVISFSGYLIDLLEAIAMEDRANFTYDLATPSGFGSKCMGRLDWTREEGDDSATALQKIADHPGAYGEAFRAQYKCGESDVNDRPLSEYSTDLYLGQYYMTLDRIKVNRFTVPYKPPGQGSLGMMGIATRIHDFDDLLANHSARPICALGGTAYIDTLRHTFPELNIQEITYGSDKVYNALLNGICDIVIDSTDKLKSTVKDFSETGRCLIKGAVSKDRLIAAMPFYFKSL
jgi:hypothetical protein